MTKARRQTVKLLVCTPTAKGGLGFCCLYAFFKLHRRTGLIAARLGVDDRTIRYHKAAMDSGKYQCECTNTCLKGRLF